jgi:hypothetical protein
LQGSLTLLPVFGNPLCFLPDVPQFMGREASVLVPPGAVFLPAKRIVILYDHTIRLPIPNIIRGWSLRFPDPVSFSIIPRRLSALLLFLFRKGRQIPGRKIRQL